MAVELGQRNCDDDGRVADYDDGRVATNPCESLNTEQSQLDHGYRSKGGGGNK